MALLLGWANAVLQIVLCFTFLATIFPHSSVCQGLVVSPCHRPRSARFHSRHSTPRGLDSSSRARCPRRSTCDLGWFIAAIIPIIDPANAAFNETTVTDGCRVPIVAVHPGDDTGSLDPYVLECRLARVLRPTIAAGAVDLADVLRVEVLDRHRAGPVVLEDLI